MAAILPDDEFDRDDLYVPTSGGFQVYEVRSIEDLIFFHRSVQDPQRFIYRGQSDATWRLETRVERDIPDGYKRLIGLQSCENSMLQRFKRRAHHYLRSPDIPAENDDLEWLALIQHYGGPTRLLDFTESIFIGAYFAVGVLNKSYCAAIWVVNRDYRGQNLDAKRHEYEQQLSSVKSSNLITAAIRREIAFPAAKTECPFRQNRRLMQQQGVFVAPLDINEPFLTNLAAMFRPLPDFTELPPKEIRFLENPDDCAVIKLVIQNDHYPQFRADLRQMNVTTEALFPDLEGEARALADILAGNVFVKGVPLGCNDHGPSR